MSYLTHSFKECVFFNKAVKLQGNLWVLAKTWYALPLEALRPEIAKLLEFVASVPSDLTCFKIKCNYENCPVTLPFEKSLLTIQHFVFTYIMYIDHVDNCTYPNRFILNSIKLQYKNKQIACQSAAYLYSSLYFFIVDSNFWTNQQYYPILNYYYTI